MMYQTYLKDCECSNGGIIINSGTAVCRWCLTPYAKGGSMSYNEEHFKSKEVKPDYEILSFISPYTGLNNVIFKVNESGMFIPDSHCFDIYTLERLLNQPTAKIHSIKRLSDGEVFAIGDVIELFGDIPTGTIDKFLIDTSDTTKISAYNNGGLDKGISAWIKVKPRPKPLFITEDGVELFKDDKYYKVYTLGDEAFHIIPARTSSDDHKDYLNLNKSIKKFSSEEAAKQYILANKPIQVSYNEIFKIIDDYNTPQVCKDEIKLFFQSKINP